jgi:hypothetical protein
MSHRHGEPCGLPVFDEALTAFHTTHPHATLSIDISASKEAWPPSWRGAPRFASVWCTTQPSARIPPALPRVLRIVLRPRPSAVRPTGLTKADLAGHSSVSFVTDRMSDALRPVTLMRAEAQLEDRIVGTSAIWKRCGA